MTKRRDSYSTDEALKRLDKAIGLSVGGWLLTGSPADLWRTCATCTHMQKKGPAHCVKFGMTPPVDIIVGTRDCEGYSDGEEIPF